MRRSTLWFVVLCACTLIASACGSQPEMTSTGGGAASGGGSTPAATPPPPPPKSATLAAGTKIKVRTTSTISTKVAKTGEAFSAVLDEALTQGDWLIADRGASVEGTIVNSDPGGRVKGVASVTVAITSLTTADGQRIALDTEGYTHLAKTTKKKDAAKVGIGAGVGAAIGAIAGGGKGAAIGAGVGGAAGTGAVLATRGDPAVIPAETAISFALRTPITVTEKKK